MNQKTKPMPTPDLVDICTHFGGWLHIELARRGFEHETDDGITIVRAVPGHVYRKLCKEIDA